MRYKPILQVEAARAALDQAKLNLDFATITSPLTGIVGRTDLSVGDFVAAGSTGAPVTTVSTVDPIKLVFSVSEKDYLEAADRIRAILAKPLDEREATAELNPRRRQGASIQRTLPSG
jgi:membrane fusion protein, multidrug efflux system